MLDELSESLKSEKLWSGIDVGSDIQKRVVQNISLILSSNQKPDKDLHSMFNFSTMESARITSLIDELDARHLDRLNGASQEYSQISDELHRVNIALSNAPNDDEIGPLFSDLNSIYENQGIIKNEIEHLEQQVAVKKAHLKMVNLKLRNVIVDKYKDEDAGIQAALAGKVQMVLDEYVTKLKMEKLRLLESYLLEEIHHLMHKKNMIANVSVDSETFEINLYDKDGNLLPKDLLSKGEKQMYATSVLLALAKTSGKPLPFMIDTPLARLDAGHRNSLVEKFLPFASHQVVIFSTDTEIDAGYYLKMRQHISRSYVMEYLPEMGKTQTA